MKRPTRQTTAGAIYHDLRNMARREGRSTDQVFQLYLLERFLHRLFRSRHRDRFVLKGGALLAAYELRRQTRDIDLRAGGLDNNEEVVARVVGEIIQTPAEEDDGIAFDVDTLSTSRIREGDRYAGIRVRLAASLARAQLAFNVDISFGDPVTPEPAQIQYPAFRGPSFPVVAYPLSTVVAEKVTSMLELGDANTRDRDFGDVHRIASIHPLDAEELREALKATARYRGVELQPLAEVLTELPARRQTPWERWRSRSGLLDLPASFGQVVEEVISFAGPLLSGTVGKGTWDPAEWRWRA